MNKIEPKYPIYVPSKGRFDSCLTAKFLIEDEVPFFLVVEPKEFDKYGNNFGFNNLLKLPRNNCGLMFARNWIKEHSKKRKDERHWQLDDNIKMVRRWWKRRRIRCRAGIALKATEDFVDRYTNVAVAGLNYTFFSHKGGTGGPPDDPFWLNAHVYSCSLILNKIKNKWRRKYNDDTDLCLQVLSAGWCTVSMNAFMIDKARTMTVKGGNTPIYQQDGRLEMSRSLERDWPKVVETKRRFGRPQHVIKGQWRKFDTPLKRRSDIDFNKFKPVDDYGMKAKKVGSIIKSDSLRRCVEESAA